jgi:alpha-1,2-mannosyltransferase
MTMCAGSAVDSGDRRRRLGIRIAWLAGGCSAGLAAAATLQFVMGSQVDFSVYLTGASHLLDGRVYQVGLPQPPHLRFAYPPFAAVLFYPLTVIPVKAAQLIWGLVNVVALYAVVHLSLRAALRTAPGTVVVLASLILMTPVYWLDPVHRTLMYGQVNLVLAALVLADFTGSLSFRGRRLPRGVLLGIAAAIKLTPLVFILYLLVSRRMRAAGVALAVFGACCAVAAALSPSAWRSYWPGDVFNTSRVGAPLYYITNQSLHAAVDRAAHAIASPTLVTLLSVAVLTGGLALAAWAFRASSDLLGVLVAAATGLLVSPVTWDHHMVWIVPAIIWLACASDRPARGWAWALAAAALFWVAPIWLVPHGHGAELHENIWQFLGGNSFFLAVIAFLTGTAAMLVTRHQSAKGRSIPIPAGAGVSAADERQQATRAG